ncbi:hypothetical protein MRB53_040115 [Persea americana]|nr:hypothetical protein MRB53_040115 [Persea americana]
MLVSIKVKKVIGFAHATARRAHASARVLIRAALRKSYKYNVERSSGTTGRARRPIPAGSWLACPCLSSCGSPARVSNAATNFRAALTRQDRNHDLESLINLLAHLRTRKDNLAADEDEEHNLRLHHAIDQAREQLGLVGAEVVVTTGHPSRRMGNLMSQELVMLARVKGNILQHLPNDILGS